MPLVSVCIPTHNTARYLPEAIESVLDQEFDDYELVVCDNASTDNTPAICAKYVDVRFRYARFEEKVIQPGSFNRCLEQARGEFITILHADDYLLPGFLADRVKRLSDHPEAGFAFGAVKVVNAAGADLPASSPWTEDKQFKPGELLESLVCGCLVSPPSLMVRRSAVLQAGPFRTDITWGHDWEWTLRLAEQSPSVYASTPLSAYRVHDDSGTAEILRAAKNGEQERLILRDTLARLEQSGQKLGRSAFRALARRHMYFGEQSLLAGQRTVARYNLRYAARADARVLLRPTFWAIFLASLGPASMYGGYRKLRDAF